MQSNFFSPRTAQMLAAISLAVLSTSVLPAHAGDYLPSMGASASAPLRVQSLKAISYTITTRDKDTILSPDNVTYREVGDINTAPQIFVVRSMNSAKAISISCRSVDGGSGELIWDVSGTAIGSGSSPEITVFDDILVVNRAVEPLVNDPDVTIHQKVTIFTPPTPDPPGA